MGWGYNNKEKGGLTFQLSVPSRRDFMDIVFRLFKISDKVRSYR